MLATRNPAFFAGLLAPTRFVGELLVRRDSAIHAPAVLKAGPLAGDRNRFLLAFTSFVRLAALYFYLRRAR